MLGLFFVVTFGSCLDVAAIQADMPEPIDFNNELATVGISNMVVGVSGSGYTGSYIFSQTIFSMRAGVSTWVHGAIIAGLEGLIFLLPFSGGATWGWRGAAGRGTGDDTCGLLFGGWGMGRGLGGASLGIEKGGPIGCLCWPVRRISPLPSPVRYLNCCWGHGGSGTCDMRLWDQWVVVEVGVWGRVVGGVCQIGSRRGPRGH